MTGLIMTGRIVFDAIDQYFGQLVEIWRRAYMSRWLKKKVCGA